jgi:hypothetical protein
MNNDNTKQRIGMGTAIGAGVGLGLAALISLTADGGPAAGIVPGVGTALGASIGWLSHRRTQRSARARR